MTRNSILAASVAVALLLAFAPAAPAADITGTYNVNTTLTNGDTWTAGDVTINGGTTVVNIPAAATVTFDSAGNRNLAGDGTFRVDATGTFLHDTSNVGDNVILTGTGTLDNLGTFEFSNGGDVRVQGTGSTFTNSGTILKSSGSSGTSNDPSYFFPNTTTTGGTFLNTGDITVNAGHLNIALGSSTGGNLTTAGSGILSFSGRWTELTGVASEGGGVITLSNENPAGTTAGRFTADAATTVLNVTGDGLQWTTATIALNGNLLRNDGILRVESAGTRTMAAGSDTFQNSATGEFRWTNGTINLNGNTFSSVGTINVSPGGGKTLTGTGTFENAVGGVANFNAATVTTFDNTFSNLGESNIVSGTVTFDGTAGFTNEVGGTLNLKSTAVLVINDTVLTNDGTATFAEAGNKELSGDAAFVNNGSFIHSHTGGTDNLIGNGTGGFVNNGTFDFQAGGDIDLAGSSYTITNNGLFMRTGAAGDNVYVFRNGNFVNASGGEVRSTDDNLVIALNNSTSDAGSTWTANGGTIQIGGSWSGTFNGSGPDEVFVGTHGNGTVGKQILVVDAAGIVMNITNGGFELQSQAIDTTAGSFTNTGTFAFVGTTSKSITGGGTFQNTGAGDMSLIGANLTLAGTDLLNAASFDLGGNMTLDGTGSLINQAAGTMDWIASATTSNFTLDTTLTNQGTFNIVGSMTHTLSGSGTFENAAAGTMNWSDGELALNNDLTNNGTFNFISGDENLGGSGTFINNGTFNHDSPTTSDNITGSSTGTFENNGLFDFTDVGDFQLTDNYTFTNTSTGTVRKTGAGGNESLFFHFGGGSGTGGTFDNQGTVEVLAGQLEIRKADGSTFDDIVVPQYDSGTSTLTGGTWIVDAAVSGSAILDLQPADGLTTIGAGATVELTGQSGSGATFVQLATLTTVNGTLLVNQQTLTPPGALTVGPTGTIGGDGTIAGALAAAGTIVPGDLGVGTFSTTGDLSLAGTTTLQVELGAPNQAAGSGTDLIDVTGNLLLDGIVSGTAVAGFGTPVYGDMWPILTYTGTLTDVGLGTSSLPPLGPNLGYGVLTSTPGTIFLVVVPEPSTLLLLGLGGLGLMAGRRRRRR